MRSRLNLVPAALVAFAGPAIALDNQSIELAQARLFRGQSLAPADFALTEDQLEYLRSEYEVPFIRPRFKAWRTSAGDWLFLDQVYGLQDIISYAVAIDAKGVVTGIEILVCVEGYCDIAKPEWRALLVGKTYGKWSANTGATTISGATLSSVHVVEGVKKLLAIHTHYLAKEKPTAPS